MDYLVANPSLFRKCFLTSTESFKAVVKLIYAIHVLNIPWYPFTQILLKHQKNLLEKNDNTKLVLISPIIYMFYGIFHRYKPDVLKIPLVNNLCQLYSTLLIVPIIITRCYLFAFPSGNNFESPVLYLDIIMEIWWFSYLIQEIIQFRKESSLFEKGRFKLMSFSEAQRSRKTIQRSDSFTKQLKNRKYLRNYWNQIDWLLIASMFVYFIAEVADHTRKNRMPSDLALGGFSVATTLVVFRLLELLQPLFTGIAPYLEALAGMWREIVFFMILVLMLAFAHALGLSVLLCNDMYKLSFNSPEIQANYSECLLDIFVYLFLKPLGTSNSQQILISSVSENTTDIRKNFERNLSEYSPFLRYLIILTITVYYVTTAFCLLRGVMIKFVIQSKSESKRSAKLEVVKKNLQILYFDEGMMDYPIPWNLIQLGMTGLKGFWTGLKWVLSCVQSWWDRMRGFRGSVRIKPRAESYSDKFSSDKNEENEGKIEANHAVQVENLKTEVNENTVYSTFQ